jgi:BMFP domain-containing protein YqiC
MPNEKMTYNSVSYPVFQGLLHGQPHCRAPLSRYNHLYCTILVHTCAQGRCSKNTLNSGFNLNSVTAMIDNQTISKLAERLAQNLPEGVRVLKDDLDNNARALLESALRDMNLVSREEFDVQTALLQRSQQKLQQLEQQLDELIRKIDQQ